MANGQAWNGPGEPPSSSVPAGTPTRGWAYPIVYNSFGDPRSAKVRESGGIGFQDLRELANQVHVRAAIETVKNAQCKKEWTFVLRPKPGERSTEASRRSAADTRITEVAEFFEQPDGEHDGSEWLRMVLEDVLVLDAPAIYNARRNNGKPYALEVFDGATIKPLLADDGRSPQPPEDAYQQWLYGSPGEKFSRADLLYSPRNPRSGRAFGYSPVEQLCFYINIAIRKDLQRLAIYTDGNIPAGMLPMPEEWDAAEIMKWWVSFNAFTKNLPQNASRLLPIPGGAGAPIFPSLETNKDAWEESWIRLVCFAFDISVSALVKEMTRATAQVAQDSVQQDGAAAYTDWVRRRYNWIIRNWFGYPDIIVKERRELDVDPKVQADIDHIELQDGTLQVNEKREREGREPYKELEGRIGFIGQAGWTEFPKADASVLGAAAIGGVTEASKAEGPYDYASIQVNISGRIRKTVLAMAAAIPDDALVEKGRESDPHVTVKFGLQPSVTLDEIRAVTGRNVAGSMTFGPTAFFPSEDYDIVFLTVSSPDLKAMNASISSSLDTVDTQPNYVPHGTLAYVKPGHGHEFAGIGTLSGVEYSYSAIWYNDADGNLTKLQTVTGHVRATPDVAKAATPHDLSTISEILKADDEKLRLLMKPFQVDALNVGMRQIADVVGVDALVGIDDPRVVEFLEKRGNQIVSVNETTANEITTAVRSMVAEGKTPEAIRSSILDAFDLKKSQAELISRNEVGAGLSGGRFIQMDEEGIDSHEWVTSGQDNVRPTHGAQNHVIVKLGDEFPNGCKYPQDPDGDEDETIGCNCITLPVVGDAKSVERLKDAGATWRQITRAGEPVVAKATPILQAYFDDQRGRVIAALVKAGVAA